jgi:sugar lactone lactonase YvrE
MVDFLVREYLSVPVTGQFGKAHDVLHDLGLPLEVQERVDEVGVSLIVPILTAALKEGTDGTTAASRLGEVFMRADQLLGKGTLPAPVPEGTPLPLPTPPAAQAYEVSTVAGSASGAQGMADGPGASATFAQPRALALGPDHSLYVAEDFNSAIRRVRFDATGAATVETVVGGKPGMADGPAASARLNGPIALAFDHEGRLLVLDYYNKAIRRLTFDAAGKATVETIFPAPGAQAPEDFQDTSALAVAPDDSLVLASITTNTLSRLQEGPNGWTFTHLNMPQGASATRIEGPLAQAGFDKPHGVAFAPDGALWESEIDTGAVRRVAEPFSPTAATEVVAGSHARLPDGPLFWTSAWIQRPFGLAIDGEGRAVVSDAVSHRILRVRPDSWVEVLAGGGPFNGKGSDGTYVDGNGADARFNTPWGVAVDGDTIYVAEYAGNRIRRLRPLER